MTGDTRTATDNPDPTDLTPEVPAGLALHQTPLSTEAPSADPADPAVAVRSGTGAGTDAPAPAESVESTESAGADGGVDAERTASSPDRTRPLRVALFTDAYGPGHNGVLYAVQFLEGQLLRNGFEVQVVAPRSDGPNPYRGSPGRTELRLPSIHIPGIPSAVAGGRGFERALDDMAADPPDVIHVSGLGPIGLLGVWAADRTEAPLMVTWHTDFEAYADYYAALTPFLDAYYRLLKVATRGMKRPGLSDMRRWMKVKWWKRGMSRRNLINAARDMLQAADLVTTPSGKTAMRVRETAPHAHIRVVPNGVDPLPAGEPLHRSANPRILYVGRIAPEKNLGLLLHAFEWVREELPNAELMIVGDWQDAGTNLQQKLKRARRRNGVILVGQVPHDKLAPYYDSADVFVFPSLTDTQALVLHEAANEGLPIVLVDHELRLVVDEGVNAAVARPTPESLARQLVMMLDRLKDPEYKARAQARSREMASWWTVQHQSETIIGLYRDLAARREIPESMKAIPPTAPGSDAPAR